MIVRRIDCHRNRQTKLIPNSLFKEKCDCHLILNICLNSQSIIHKMYEILVLSRKNLSQEFGDLPWFCDVVDDVA